MTDFAGVFETHLTVRPHSPHGDADQTAGQWAKGHGMRYTRILLDRGDTPDQPMLTYRGRGTLPTERARARTWRDRLRDAGLTVVRVKIEAAPGNADVPQTARDAAALPPGLYFEHHVKLVLAGAAEVDAVRAIGAPHAAHVSRNARRHLPGGRHERFVTQRCRRVGRPEARRRLQALLDALAAAGHLPVEVEEEFVVHDDNPGADAGWEVEA